MIINVLLVVACVALGAYGMLFVMGLCMVSASAGRQMESPSSRVNPTAQDSKVCSLCEKTVVSRSRSIQTNAPLGSADVSRYTPSRTPSGVTADANGR